MKALLPNSKKAQAGTLQTIIITLLIVGIILGVGFMLYDEFSENIGTTVGTVTNETLTLVDLPTGVYALANTTDTNCFHNFVITAVENETSFATIDSGNYSYDTNTGQIWNTTVYDISFSPAGVVNVSYTYLWSGSEACAAIEDTIDATETIPTWLTIIVILVIVGLMLFIVFKILPSGGENAHESSGSSGGFFSSMGSNSSSAEM